MGDGAEDLVVDDWVALYSMEDDEARSLIW